MSQVRPQRLRPSGLAGLLLPPARKGINTWRYTDCKPNGLHDTPSSMEKPVDQKIVDDFFKLSTGNNTKNIAWLYGMVATYGIKPTHLQRFSWGPENTILLKGRKRPVKPLHPHWAIIFNLKKQPRNIQDRLETICDDLKKAITTKTIKCEIKELLFAHRERKKNFYAIKR